jgi:hypothetical protein
MVIDCSFINMPFGVAASKSLYLCIAALIKELSHYTAVEGLLEEGDRMSSSGSFYKNYPSCRTL